MSGRAGERPHERTLFCSRGSSAGGEERYHESRATSWLHYLIGRSVPPVESIPGKVSGAWVFRGTRVPVSAIFENLKTSSLEEVLENFHVTREQVQSVLDFAARSLQHSPKHLRVG
jgi:uncharacterized protein (DUF433 family)